MKNKHVYIHKSYWGNDIHKSYWGKSVIFEWKETFRNLYACLGLQKLLSVHTNTFKYTNVLGTCIILKLRYILNLRNKILLDHVNSIKIHNAVQLITQC